MELPVGKRRSTSKAQQQQPAAGGGQASPVDLAVVWVDKASKGRSGWVRSCSEFQLKAYRLRKRLKPFMDAVKWTMLGLALFETPSWCLFNDEECFGTHKESLFASGAPQMPLAVSNMLQLGCLLCFVAYLVVRRWSLGEADEFRPISWHSFGLACVLLGLIDSTVAIFNVGGIVPGTFKLTRLLRPFIFLAFTTNLREAAERVVRSVPWFADVLFTLALCLFFFVWVGIVIFAQTAGGRVHFPSWAESFSNMWILFTTANNPDAWVQIYVQHRIAFFFFASYIVLTVYLLNNLILSSIYDAYKEQLTNMVVKADQNTQTSLEEAFELLKDDSGKISPEAWVDFFLHYFQAKGCASNEAWNRKRAAEVFKILDDDGSNGLSLEEFSLVTKVLHDDQEYIPKSRPPSSSATRCLRALLTQTYRIGGFLISEEVIVDAVIAVGISLAFAQTVLYFNDGDFRLQWLDWSNPLSLVIFSLTIFYVLEVTARLVVLGPERFWNQNACMNRLDLVNVYGLVVAEAVCKSIPAYADVGSHLVVLLHIARCLRLFRHVKQLRFVAHLTVRLWPTYYRMGMLLLLLFYIFDTIGVQVFGGLIYKGNPALKDSGFASADYWPFNFNDFNSGMVTMFLLMVVNNWFVFASAFMAVTGTRLAAVFFLSFFVITNLIVLNVLMSLILDLSGSVREELLADEAEAAEAAEAAADEDGLSGADVPRKAKKGNDYMHMIRNVLLAVHHGEDDGIAGGSPKTGLSSGSLASRPSYGAV